MTLPSLVLKPSDDSFCSYMIRCRLLTGSYTSTDHTLREIVVSRTKLTVRLTSEVTCPFVHKHHMFTKFSVVLFM